MLRKGVKSFYDWCIENDKIRYVELWDYDLNQKSPKDVAASDNVNKYYFKCENDIHDSYLKSIQSLTRSKDLVCPRCNSIYQWCLDNNRQDIIDSWDKELNDISMDLVSKSSSKKYWFTFEHYSYYYPIAYITQKK